MSELRTAVAHDPGLRIGRKKRVVRSDPQAPGSLVHWRQMKYAFARARKFVKLPDPLAVELDAAIESLDITIRAWHDLE